MDNTALGLKRRATCFGDSKHQPMPINWKPVITASTKKREQTLYFVGPRGYWVKQIPGGKNATA